MILFELRLVGQASKEAMDYHQPEHYWRLRGVREPKPIQKNQILVLDTATYLPNSHIIAVQPLYDMTPVLSEIGRDTGTSELAFCIYSPKIGTWFAGGKTFLLDRTANHSPADWEKFITQTVERYRKFAKKVGATT